MMEAAAPNVNQRAARDMNDPGGFIELDLQCGRAKAEQLMQAIRSVPIDTLIKDVMSSVETRSNPTSAPQPQPSS